MAFGRQCLHYRHRGERVFNWCLVPRLEWIYLDADDADPAMSEPRTGTLALRLLRQAPRDAQHRTTR